MSQLLIRFVRCDATSSWKRYIIIAFILKRMGNGCTSTSIKRGIVTLAGEATLSKRGAMFRKANWNSLMLSPFEKKLRKIYPENQSIFLQTISRHWNTCCKNFNILSLYFYGNLWQIWSANIFLFLVEMQP